MYLRMVSNFWIGGGDVDQAETLVFRSDLV